MTTATMATYACYKSTKSEQNSPQSLEIDHIRGTIGCFFIGDVPAEPVEGALSGRTSSTGHGAWSMMKGPGGAEAVWPRWVWSPSRTTMGRPAPSAAATTSRSGRPRRSLVEQGRPPAHRLLGQIGVHIALRRRNRALRPSSSRSRC